MFIPFLYAYEIPTNPPPITEVVVVEDEGLPTLLGNDGLPLTGLEPLPVPEAPIPISPEAVEEIKRSEGLVLSAYFDYGQYSIGYGSGTHLDGRPVTYGDRVTEEEAEEMLFQLLEKYTELVDKVVKVPLNPHQRGALVSLAYNIGPNAFRNSTLVELLNRSDYQRAADQFQWWRNAGGRINQGLVERRRRERLLFLMPYLQPQPSDANLLM